MKACSLMLLGFCDPARAVDLLVRVVNTKINKGTQLNIEF